jgi:hypothetical protein
LAADDDAASKLQQALKNLVLRAPEESGAPAKLSGKRFVFPANDHKLEAIALESSDNRDETTLVVRTGGAERRIACGRGVWCKGRLSWNSSPEQPAAASGAWTADDTYTAKLCFYETPFIVTLRLKFSGDDLQCQSESNVGFGPNKAAELTGKAE